MIKILIVEDDKNILNTLTYYLQNEGFSVKTAQNIHKAIDIIKNEQFNIVLLDITLPDGNGYDFYKKLKEKSNTPVIFLTALDEEKDIVKGFDLGADDYITKPFNPLELIARVKSNVRRYVEFGNMSKKDNKKVLKTGDLEIDDDTKKVTVDGKDIKLTATEYNILKFLLQNKGKVFSISQIYENVWNEESYGAENIIAVHIRHIREKIEINPKEPKYLKVIWGIGYKIEDIS